MFASKRISVVHSNCKFNSMMTTNLVFLRFSKSALKSLKCILHISENIATIKYVKYHNKSFFIKSFSKLKFVISLILEYFNVLHMIKKI